MSEEREKDDLSERDEAALASLLRLGGPRSPVPDDAEARVYEQVRRAWEDTNPRPGEDRVYSEVRRAWQRGDSRRRRSRTLWLPLAFAATVLAAVGLWLRPVQEGDAVVAPIAGTVVFATGNTLALGTELLVGDRINTGAGEALSIRLANGESLRVDEGTELAILGGYRFDLGGGRIYADTGDRVYRDGGLVIETPHGLVRDVGTQFAVTSDRDELAVAVREGRVDLERRGGTVIAVAGERLRVADGESPAVDRLAPYDPWWEWATALAPSFDGQDQSVLDVLRWAARETGRELVFEDPELRLAAMRADLHGSVADFTPLEAVESALATTNFEYRIEADRILIGQ